MQITGEFHWGTVSVPVKTQTCATSGHVSLGQQMTTAFVSDIDDEIREGVRRLCASYPKRVWRDCDERHEFPWSFHETLAEGGWIGVPFRRNTGVRDEGVAEASVVLEEIPLQVPL